MKKLLVSILALTASHLLLAQQSFDPEEEASTGLPEIIENLNNDQDPRLNNMIKWQIENNIKKNGADGYRVEIFTSSNSHALEESSEIKKEFLVSYPDIEVHIKYNAPFFKVRIGDFRTRNEALKLLKEVDDKYPNAFIVEDIIKYPELITKE